MSDDTVSPNPIKRTSKRREKGKSRPTDPLFLVRFNQPWMVFLRFFAYCALGFYLSIFVGINWASWLRCDLHCDVSQWIIYRGIGIGQECKEIRKTKDGMVLLKR